LILLFLLILQLLLQSPGCTNNKNRKSSSTNATNTTPQRLWIGRILSDDYKDATVSLLERERVYNHHDPHKYYVLFNMSRRQYFERSGLESCVGISRPQLLFIFWFFRSTAKLGVLSRCIVKIVPGCSGLSRKEKKFNCVATVNRTRGLKIFSLALSQLSYCDTPIDNINF
jgi:hypothetical protein